MRSASSRVAPGCDGAAMQIASPTDGSMARIRPPWRRHPGGAILLAALFAAGCRDLLGLESPTLEQASTCSLCAGTGNEPPPDAAGGTQSSEFAAGGSMAMTSDPEPGHPRDAHGGAGAFGGNSNEPGMSGSNGGRWSGGGAMAHRPNEGEAGSDTDISGGSGGVSGSTPSCEPETCPNADPEHCEVSCSPELGAACCRVAARDADGDDHGSAACEAAPGDDCDDERADVHPGAKERCDGVDNDCDGRMDLADGYSVWSNGSLWFPFDNQLNDIAWWPALDAYGVLSADSRSLHVSVWSRSGASARSRPYPDSAGNGVALAANDELLGMLTLNDTLALRTWNANDDVSLVRDAIVQESLLSSSPVLFALPAQTWLALWTTYQSFHAFGVLIEGAGSSTEAEPMDLGFLGYLTSAARSADTLLLTGTLSNHAYALLVSTTLDQGIPLELGGSGLDELTDFIASGNEKGFGVLGRLTPDKVLFRALERSGAERCRSLPLEVGSFVPATLVPTANGYTIFSQRPQLEALEVNDDCSFGRRVTIVDHEVSSLRAAAAREGGYLVAFSDEDGVKSRVFGPNFCDSPL